MVEQSIESMCWKRTKYFLCVGIY